MIQRFFTALIFVFALSGTTLAQDRVFKCGNNEYINNAQEAESRKCQPLSSRSVTVVRSSRLLKSSPGVAPESTSRNAQTRVDSAQQRARDDDSRSILESELKKAEAKLAEQRREYNNGEPEKLGPETRNHQKYLTRIEELKQSIARSESDVAGIKRELARLPGGR